jgi:hypothetical protein
MKGIHCPYCSASIEVGVLQVVVLAVIWVKCPSCDREVIFSAERKGDKIMMDGAPEVANKKEKGGVAREMDRLSKKLDSLSSHLSTLESMLSPVLKNSVTENGDSPVPEATSELAGIIRVASDRLERSTMVVKEIQERLDL